MSGCPDSGPGYSGLNLGVLQFSLLCLSSPSEKWNNNSTCFIRVLEEFIELIFIGD